MGGDANLTNNAVFYLLVLVIGLMYVHSWPIEQNEFNSYMGTVESVRKNIEDLFEGKLEFSDENLPYDKNELSDTTPKHKDEYDFIVIGAGSAGATVASRLSEIPNITVLLIEAGGKEYPITDIPFMGGSLQLSDQVNWKYQTESSDKYCLGMTDHKCNWPRGKITGGSSVLNLMVATRCNKKDYDDWARETNDDSWSYKNMLKYLMKLENYHIEGDEIDQKSHNKSGPVHITQFPGHNNLTDAFIEAGKELGYPELQDNEEKSGFIRTQSTIYNGERWSTNRAYLRPAKNRKNLIFSRNSFVREILIESTTKRAYGVRFSKSHTVIEVRARKEIILSAGAINSPQILMLSGIGPAKHLNNLNITVIKDAPVGENLMDHVAYSGLIFKVNDSSTYKNQKLVDPENNLIKEYVESRNGILGDSGYGGLGYFNADDPSPTNERPNIELIFSTLGGIKNPFISKLVGVDETYRNLMSADKFDHSSWFLYPMIMSPKSRGKLLLKSINPYEKPKIYPNYFSEPEDVRALIKGIRMVLKLSQTSALQKYGSELYQVPLPNCQHHEKDSDDYWECAMRTHTFSIYHYSGTCKMGRKNDKTAVLDSQLNVIGVNGLRVIDASIMPNIVSAHPNIPIIAIAEKMSDQIKKKYGYLD